MTQNSALTIGFGFAIGAVVVGVWAAKGTRGLNGASRRRGGLRGPTEERELLLFCENDGDLYRQQQPIEKNLRRKLEKGTYDHEKAKKLWGYLADNCARKYVKEFGSEGQPWHKAFSTADRRGVAKAFADSFRDEHEHQARHGITPGGRSR